MIFNLICFSRNKKALNVGKFIRIKMDATPPRGGPTAHPQELRNEPLRAPNHV